MAAGNAVWGIDIGQCALKALKLRSAGDGKVEAVGFDLIEHAKILSQPDAEPDELIRAALEKFATRNDWQGDRFVLGVPGQQTFSRFCKMPPVDAKKIPDLVKFEASQQIPFDMDDVVWDYQTFSTPDSPDLEVGIFAMRKDLIRKQVDFLSAVGISPAVVQTIPCALYNFSRFEQPNEDPKAAMVIISVGAQNTELVIVEPNSAWTRNIPLGGNNFTEALVRAFKLSFAKAESLKRTAASSKYARQIFQAMRPVFAELVAEIQRSIGFFSSTHRDVELRSALALGNAFRLPGLQKYLENNLTISGGVSKPERFNQFIATATINAPQFTENILTFAPAYGLALQGLGLAKINASMLPSELARLAVWNRKRPYFIAAAAAIGIAAILPYTRNMLDSQALASTEVAVQSAKTAIEQAQKYKTKFQEVQNNTNDQEKAIKDLLNLRQDQSLVAQILTLPHLALPESHESLNGVQSLADFERLWKSGQLPARNARKQFLIDSIDVKFVEDLDTVSLLAPGGGGGPTPRPTGPRGQLKGGAIDTGEIGVGPAVRKGGGKKPERKNAGFEVRLTGRLLYGERDSDVQRFLEDEYFKKLRELGNQPGRNFYIPDDNPQDKTKPNIAQTSPFRRFAATRAISGPAGVVAAAGPETLQKDPVTGEDTGNDWRVEIGFKVKLGEKPQPGEEKTKPQGKKPKP
jgi:type IV pilus assembly protein PilM